MSIIDEIEGHCQRGSLIMFEAVGNPRQQISGLKQRKLYVSPGIQGFLDSDRRLVEATRGDFSEFVSGELIRVALHLDHFECLMARLEPSVAEIWEIRIYDIEPQLRFYGRFAECDCFVALMGPREKSWFSRKKLDHNRIKKACTAEWNRLFKSAALSKGEDINAYLSSNIDPA